MAASSPAETEDEEYEEQEEDGSSNTDPSYGPSWKVVDRQRETNMGRRSKYSTKPNYLETLDITKRFLATYIVLTSKRPNKHRSLH